MAIGGRTIVTTTYYYLVVTVCWTQLEVVSIHVTISRYVNMKIWQHQKHTCLDKIWQVEGGSLSLRVPLSGQSRLFPERNGPAPVSKSENRHDFAALHQQISDTLEDFEWCPLQRGRRVEQTQRRRQTSWPWLGKTPSCKYYSWTRRKRQRDARESLELNSLLRIVQQKVCFDSTLGRTSR